MANNASETDLTRILELKGCKKDERNEILQRFNNPNFSSNSSNSSAYQSSSNLANTSGTNLSSTPPSSSVPAGLTTSGTFRTSKVNLKKFIPDSLLTMNK